LKIDNRTFFDKKGRRGGSLKESETPRHLAKLEKENDGPEGKKKRPSNVLGSLGDREKSKKHKSCATAV